MYTVIIIMTSGMIFGFIIRSYDKKNDEKKNLFNYLNKLITGLIFLLLFFLGVSVGTNEIIIKNLDIIGIKALILTLGSVLGSIFTAYLTYKFFFKD